MAWTFNISAIVDGESDVTAYGQVQLSGNYATGGDTAGTFVTTPGANTAGWPDFHMSSALHASLPPIVSNLQIDGGYVGVVVPQAGFIPALKILNPATNAEIPAGAYPAALTGAKYHALELRYRKNL